MSNVSPDDRHIAARGGPAAVGVRLLLPASALAAQRRPGLLADKYRTSCLHDHGLVRAVDNDQRTAKWTANTDRLAGTHRPISALGSQVSAIAAQAGVLPDLHGMQEARGSSPLSSTVYAGQPLVLGLTIDPFKIV
jgi:hypothetical protein